MERSGITVRVKRLVQVSPGAAGSAAGGGTASPPALPDDFFSWNSGDTTISKNGIMFPDSRFPMVPPDFPKIPVKVARFHYYLRSVGLLQSCRSAAACFVHNRRQEHGPGKGFKFIGADVAAEKFAVITGPFVAVNIIKGRQWNIKGVRW